MKSKIGLKEIEFKPTQSGANESLDGKLLRFLQIANNHLPPIGENGWLRGNLQELLTNIRLDEKLQLSIDETCYIMQIFEASNQKVFDRYLKFKLKDNPFQKCLHNQKEMTHINPISELTVEDACYIFAEVWKQKQTQFVDLKNNLSN